MSYTDFQKQRFRHLRDLLTKGKPKQFAESATYQKLKEVENEEDK